METLIQDLRYAFRQLRRAPGFFAVAVLTLALGIGANTAVFSVVNGVLLKPLPYPDADRVTYLSWLWTRDAEPAVLSAHKFAYWREHARVFEGVATYKTFGSRLGEAGGGYVQGLRVSGDFFGVIGIPPAIGRGFTTEENEPGGPQAAVLGHGLWRGRYGGNPDIVGRTIRLDGEQFTVVGVAGRRLRLADYEEYGDVLVPLQLEVDPQDQAHNYPVIARLEPGVTPDMAEADMARVFQSFRAEYPDQVGPEEAGVGLFSHAELFAGEVRSLLWILLAATLLVLLIACADVANLLLARATGRRREIATRAALGAGRRRIVRQILTESLLLGLAASGLGLVLAFWSLDALLAAVPVSMPRADAIGLDGRVLSFTLTSGLATAVVVGLAGALALLRIEPAAELSGNRVGESRAARRMSRTLVIVESAMSLVLLVGAGHLIASLFELRAVDPGFDSEGVLTARFPRPTAEYD
ncbi:MAG: ABC transporter permease, partial [Geminicoccales bacterium]